MDEFLFDPSNPIRLDKFATEPPEKFIKNGKSETRLEALRVQLRLQIAMLRAEAKHKVLIVLQGLDASGKDGTIRHVFYGVTHFGIRVVAFDKPTRDELAHDYLWRVHKETPASGELVVFNRSHYEDVLVVRVRDLQPKRIWRKRYEHINAFEKLLTDEGTTILKFYLAIGKKEQKKRLQARLDEPHKHWKFNPADLDDRAHWDDYVGAFQEMLERTSKPEAPWFVIPADSKIYRNLVIAEILVDHLNRLNMEFPPLPADIQGMIIES